MPHAASGYELTTQKPIPIPGRYRDFELIPKSNLPGTQKNGTPFRYHSDPKYNGRLRINIEPKRLLYFGTALDGWSRKYVDF